MCYNTLAPQMYDFSTDYETFYTGATNPGISGLYATYRGKTNLPQWDGEHCSNIELASDGTKFKSFIQPNETIKFFRKSMCRPINLVSWCKWKYLWKKLNLFSLYFLASHWWTANVWQPHRLQICFWKECIRQWCQ